MLVVAVLGGGGAAFAHHSYSVFDMKSTKRLSGTVKDFQWTHPHTWVWMYVENARGELDQWAIEGMSPNYLGRRGWNRNTLRPGDKVQIEIHPLRNGERGGVLVNVTLPDGRVLRIYGAHVEGERAPDRKH